MCCRYVNANQNNVDYLNNVRHDANKHFRNKKKECLKGNFDELKPLGSIRCGEDLVENRLPSQEGLCSMELVC